MVAPSAQRRRHKARSIYFASDSPSASFLHNFLTAIAISLPHTAGIQFPEHRETDMPAQALRFTFLAKVVAALLLVLAADWLFADFLIGSWLGGLALAWVVALALVKPSVRHGPALVALLCAAGFALALIYQPGLLAWGMFWSALSIATLLPRIVGFDDAWRWAIRLLAHGLSGPAMPMADLGRLLRKKSAHGRPTIRSTAAILALPVLMSALFVTLFARANPLIEELFASIRLPSLGEVIFWLLALAIIWPSLRPGRFATRIVGQLPETEVTLPGASLPSVLISLVIFNVVFAVENSLDLIFLWSGAPLPAGVSLAEYAHRGAYPLIGTALLAGIFVLTTMKPGSATAASPAIRKLVVLWIVQNLLLVASSILRTCDYIEVYMLTGWRIAALAWMGLVALGLALICWRMLTGRSARWLINSNALVAAILLSVATIVDFDAIAAGWNVNHAREVGGRGGPLDLCQLNGMGTSALLPLIALEQRRSLNAGFRERVTFVRHEILVRADDQLDWRSWNWLDSWRRQRALALLGKHPRVPKIMNRGCGGELVDDSPPSPATQPSPAPTPSTSTPALTRAPAA
ncbi:MAG: DUF4173 domain-containing protein [Novosphingobium sp.]